MKGRLMKKRYEDIIDPRKREYAKRKDGALTAFFESLRDLHEMAEMRRSSKKENIEIPDIAIMLSVEDLMDKLDYVLLYYHNWIKEEVNSKEEFRINEFFLDYGCTRSQKEVRKTVVKYAETGEAFIEKFKSYHAFK